MTETPPAVTEPVPATPPPRRYLIATAVTNYPKAPAALEWDRPGLADARDQVIDLFATHLGYTHVSDLGLNPTEAHLLAALRDFSTSPNRRPDDLLAVYIAGHGEVLADGEHVLLTSDTDPDDIDDALPTLTLARKILRGTRVRRLLLMLDTCFSGQGGNELLSAMAHLKGQWNNGTESGLAILTSAQPNQLAESGAFPELLTQAVLSQATAGHAPETLALDAVVSAMKNHPKRPEHQTIGLEIIGLTGTVPPFLPNRRHDQRLSHFDLALQQRLERERQTDRRAVEFTSRFLNRAKGHPDPGQSSWWFSGRHDALADVSRWLVDLPASQPSLAVTGGPGSGKTAVLGLLATLSDPEQRRTVPLHTMGLTSVRLPPPRTLDAAIYAQSLTDQQVLHGITAAAQVSADTVSELVNRLEAGPRSLGPHRRPLTILIDAIDEAVTPESLCRDVLRPLIDPGTPHLRLLLGTRPHLLERLRPGSTESAGPASEYTRHIGPDAHGHAGHIDLDSERYADPEAVHAYAILNLRGAHAHSPYRYCDPALVTAVARRVARAAGRSFLVARITAGTLAAAPSVPDPQDPEWIATLPRMPGEAIHNDLTRRLGKRAAEVMDLLRPLAFAQGQGLPWEDIWAPAASAVSGSSYTNEHLRQLRSTAGSYIVEAIEDGRSVYRLYHEAMAEYLRTDQDAQAVHSALASALRATVPYGADAAPDWSRAHPYLRRHLATHAALGGVLDDLVQDPDYVVHAECDTLAPHLHLLTTDEGRLHGAVYRASIGTHRPLPPDERRAVLALDAARYGVHETRRALTGRMAADAWKPVQASGSGVSPATHNILTGHTREVAAVACTVLDGRPVAVTGSHDSTVRIWDLETGRPVGSPLIGHETPVTAVACTLVDGRPLAVTSSYDSPARIWDLESSRPVGEPLTGPDTPVDRLVCAAFEGRPVVVTVSSHDRAVRMWDLSSRRTVGPPFGHPTGWFHAVVCAGDDGRPYAVTSDRDDTVRVWDLSTGQPIGEPFTFSGGPVKAAACSEIDGRPVVVTLTPGVVQVVDLTTGQPVGQPFMGLSNMLSGLACTRLDEQPVGVVTSHDSQVLLWNLRTGRLIGSPLTGHTSGVGAVACARLGGRPIAVTVSRDHTVRVWDLRADHPIGRPSAGHAGHVIAVACGRLGGEPVVVTTSTDRTARVWRPRPGEVLDRFGHAIVGAPAVTRFEGRPVAVAVTATARPLVLTTDDRPGLGREVTVWGLEARRAIGRLATKSARRVTALACADLDGRSLAAVGYDDGTSQLWDLETYRPVGRPLYRRKVSSGAAACTRLDGRPVALIGYTDSSVRLWDLGTGEPVGRPLIGHTARVTAVECIVIDGQPVAVTGSHDKTLRMWDLTTQRPIGRPLVGHTSWVNAMVCTELDGRPVALTGSHDSTVRIWDLLPSATRPTTTPLLRLSNRCRALAVSDHHLAVVFGNDVAFFTRARTPSTRSGPGPDAEG
ncbi:MULTISPECIES: caspase family protein [unclassified Streptomyces]|uniref:caspase family protein n=1 Tax=unclassified Streptomyces TaxID=2593676 RepID=UPI0036EEC0EF